MPLRTRKPSTARPPPPPPAVRQYASFQDTYHLYFLFDLMPGGDLMDVLVAEAKVIKYPVPEEGTLRKGCLAQKVKMWQVCVGGKEGAAWALRHVCGAGGGQAQKLFILRARSS